ncbi:hypothetical protein GC163_21115 [bacterium]|nr:hypothetical protein [bacterium]
MKTRPTPLPILHDLSPMPDIPKGHMPIFMDINRRGMYRNQLLQEGRGCTYCGCALTKGSARLDHLIPVSRGGMDIARNLVLCCERCNSCKGTRSVRQYVADLLKAGRELRRRMQRKIPA